MASKQRYYPHVEGDESVKTAIKQLHDHVYDLRDENDAHKKTITDLHAKVKAQNGKIAYSDNVLGVKIKGVTDKTTLVTGNTLKYNEATGAFEIKP